MSQPCVGMMDGVAASRAECTARLSAASLNEDASRLARRIRPFRSTRISLERRMALPASPPAADTVGPPMPAAWTCGSIGSRLARTLMRASRWEMRERVSARPESRPLSSPSCCSRRAFSCAKRADFERSTVRETVTYPSPTATTAASTAPPMADLMTRYETSMIFEGSEPCGTKTTVQRRLPILAHLELDCTDRCAQRLASRSCPSHLNSATQSIAIRLATA